VSFPDAGWPDKKCRFVLGNEIATGERFNLLRVERRLEGEVEFFERFGDGEACRSKAFIEPFVIAGTQLVVDEGFKELEVTKFGVNGALVMRFEHGCGMAESEFAKLLV